MFDSSCCLCSDYWILVHNSCLMEMLLRDQNLLPHEIATSIPLPYVVETFRV